MEKGSAIGQSSAEYLPSSGNGSIFIEKDWEDPPHRRAFSESFLLEEQPSWLDELLDEPETPVHIGVHQRSSSDSLAYTGVASLINMGVARDTLSRQVQYIDKLDRKVQALQTEASEAFAKLESLELESFFLGMYNEVLKICLEGFAQEQRVKCHSKFRFENVFVTGNSHFDSFFYTGERKEELKREYKRLRALTQQQQGSQGSGH